MHIKRAILKYGKENFTVEVLEDCSISELDEREKYYIERYDSYKNGYNCTKGGQKGAKPLQTSEAVQKQIVALYKYGFSLRAIGEEFKIDHATVKGVLTHNRIPLRSTRTYKLSQDDRQNLKEDIKNGLSRKDVQVKYNISKSYLSQLITESRRI